MKRYQYDLVIIGAGSGGYAAARTARELGASVALVDHGPLGGLCILRGCMPSKALIASSDAIADLETFKELGVHAGDVRVDFAHIMQRKAELIRGFADYRIEGIEKFPVYGGRATFVSDHEVQVGEDTILHGKKFIVATGSVVAPAAAVHGLTETGYIDSDGALQVQTLPKSMVVLGGGYIGCELGMFFHRMGVKVTMVLRSRHLLSTEDHDIGDALTAYYRADGIEVRTETDICGASKRGDKKIVHVKRAGIDDEIETDEILYCLGRVPNFEGLNLEDAAGVKCHAITGIEVDDTMRTCAQHIFAIGDVIAKHMLVHVAIYEGEVAARNAVCDTYEKVDYRLQTAHTIFSDPQIAVAGQTERQLQAQGVSYVKGSYEFAEHGKAMCIGKTRGFVKMMADTESGEILGAAVIGPEASDLIHEVIVAMNYHSTVQEFMRIPHLHPTLAEIWTYPAEECAEKLQVAEPGEIEPEIAASGTAG